MGSGPTRSMWVVVALLDPLAPGTAFSRREWPAHITLASNFAVDAPGDELARVTAGACGVGGPVAVRFGASAMFGTRHDVPVQLVESAEIQMLHERLADALESMPGFRARAPQHWRGGYRPHMTHVPAVTVHTGDTRDLPCIALAELTPGTATVIAAIDRSSTPRDA